VVDDLMAGGQVRRADTGMRLGDLASAERIDQAGARVIAITPGGAAARAGLIEGDVVTAIGSRRVKGRNDARAAIALARPGQRLVIAVTRGGGGITVELTLPP